MKKNHLSSMTAATMAFLLAASAPFQAFAEEANPDSSYSVDQERLTWADYAAIFAAAGASAGAVQRGSGVFAALFRRSDCVQRHHCHLSAQQ